MVINNFRLLSLDKLEKDLGQWLFLRRYRLIVLVVVLSGLVTASKLPYLNVFVSSYLIIFISLVIIPFILKIRAKVLIAIGISLFFVVFIYWIFGRADEAEKLTEYIYIILLSGVLKSFLS